MRTAMSVTEETAAEAAVGLALIIAIYRHYKTTSLDEWVKKLRKFVQ
jgi:NADH:ubiquinone oxidoreductase subunit K